MGRPRKIKPGADTSIDPVPTTEVHGARSYARMNQIDMSQLGLGVIPYDPDKADRILANIAGGVPLDAACAAANVSLASLSAWRAQAPALDEALEIALGHFHADMVDLLMSSARGGDPQTIRWILERRFVEWQPTANVALKVGKMSDEELINHAKGLKVVAETSDTTLPMPKVVVGAKPVSSLNEEGFGADAEPSANGDVVLEGENGISILDLA